MSIVLTKPLALPTAARYANPATPSEKLGAVYGDFSAGGRTGPIPAVLIDTVNRVYAAAAWAVQSIDEVWVGEVLKTLTTDYTVSLSNNYESQGVIATITFTVAHGLPTEAVTWRGKGKQDATPALIENAIDQVYDLLTTYGEFVAADFHTPTRTQATLDVTTQGYRTAWVVNDEQWAGAWLTEILFNVVGSWRINGAGTLELLVDRGGDFPTRGVAAHLVAARDCVGGDDGPEFEMDLVRLVNALDVSYLWHWARGAASSELTSPEDAVSKNAYGEVRKRVTLKGLRRSADVTAWATVVFERQAGRTRVEGGLLRATVDGPQLAGALVGDLVAFSWPYGPRREGGNLYTNELLRLASVRHDPRQGTTVFTAIDTGKYLYDDGGYYDAEVFFDSDVFFGRGRDTRRLS